MWHSGVLCVFYFRLILPKDMSTSCSACVGYPYHIRKHEIFRISLMHFIDNFTFFSTACCFAKSGLGQEINKHNNITIYVIGCSFPKVLFPLSKCENNICFVNEKRFYSAEKMVLVLGLVLLLIMPKLLLLHLMCVFDCVCLSIIMKYELRIMV